MNEAQIRERIEQYLRFPFRGKLNIVTDTTEFIKVRSGDVLELAGSYYLLRGEEMEGRFGLDGEPKYWVKRAIDLCNGSFKVIKLVFYESFLLNLGPLKIECFRSPQKEARILDKVRGDASFMQGINIEDRAGNLVRVIDKIQGTRYLDYIVGLDMDHETYFYELFPTVLGKVCGCIEAIGRLHSMGELHGDIRNDHILIDHSTGIYTWIDFDYSYQWSENPFGMDLFGLGNILLLTVGKGFQNAPDLVQSGLRGREIVASLHADDMSLCFPNRVMNLRKVFPYIPENLNNILLHFSHGSEVFYETTEELLEDLMGCNLIHEDACQDVPKSTL